MTVTRREAVDTYGRPMTVFESPDSRFSYRIERETTTVYADGVKTCWLLTRVNPIGQGWSIGRWLDLSAAEHVAYTLAAFPPFE